MALDQFSLEKVHKKKHQCYYENCNASFARPYRLANHMMFVHHNIKTYECHYLECNGTFVSLMHLKNHIKQKHEGREETNKFFRCQDCDTFFVNNQNLMRHQKEIHKKVGKRLKCEECGEEVRTHNQLLAHMYKHTQIKAFKCDLCSKEYVSVRELVKHKRSHKSSRSLCGKVFHLQNDLRKHKIMCDICSVFICDICNGKFLKRDEFKKHIAKHTSAPKVVFVCYYTNCNRKYTRKSNLMQHINVKHKELKYECSFCDRRFSAKKTLQNHLKTHPEQKEHCSNQCSGLDNNCKSEDLSEDDIKINAKADVNEPKKRTKRKDAGKHKVPVKRIVSGILL